MQSRELVVLGGGEQRLRRNAPDVDARSAESLVHLDADCIESKLGGANGGDVTTGPAADDRYITIGHLLDQHRGRIFDELLHAYEEKNGLLPVDNAVVVGERDVHHRPDLDLFVDRDG